jgi:hypothetical protein
MIEAGSAWEAKINQAIDKSEGAILLISDNFLNSDFILSYELPKLFAARELRGLYFVPLVVTYCSFNLHDQLRKFQTFNDPERPLSSLHDWEVDKEFKRLAEQLAIRFRGEGPIGDIGG